MTEWVTLLLMLVIPVLLIGGFFEVMEPGMAKIMVREVTGLFRDVFGTFSDLLLSLLQRIRGLRTALVEGQHMPVFQSGRQKVRKVEEFFARHFRPETPRQERREERREEKLIEILIDEGHKPHHHHDPEPIPWTPDPSDATHITFVPGPPQDKRTSPTDSAVRVLFTIGAPLPRPLH